MVEIEEKPDTAGEYALKAETRVQRNLEATFAFFADAGNLESITPPELHFRIETGLPIDMHAGTLIEYRLGLFGFPFRWITEITEWDPPVAFVDTQLAGPYRQWIHRHTFEEVEGGTIVRDLVQYRLPLGKAGVLVQPIVARQLRRIFLFRMNEIRRQLDDRL